tara:strand:- start:15367 stop:16458 length:1092 start_codon:yes stop_codon:yes gene_type:complete
MTQPSLFDMISADIKQVKTKEKKSKKPSAPRGKVKDYTKPPMVASPKKKKVDVYQLLTDNVLAAFEAAKKGGKWKRPWDAAAGSPENAITKKAYRGVNVLILWMAAQSQGYLENSWLTFKQAKKAKLSIKKGEKSTLIYWHQPREVKDENGDVIDTYPVFRYYRVYNTSQLTEESRKTLGVTKKKAPTKKQVTKQYTAAFSRLNDALSSFGVGREIGSPCYIPSRDVIKMPEVEKFHSPEEYVSTLAHETVHSTGHESRLNRDLTGHFGKPTYAFEELVAEIGSAFLCCQLGISQPALMKNHGQYINSWMRLMKKEKKAFTNAARLATKAVDLVLSQAEEAPAPSPKKGKKSSKAASSQSASA